MSQKKTFILADDHVKRRAIKAIANAPKGYSVVIKESTRSLDQNAAQWPILQAFSEQLRWPVNGKNEKLSTEEWKNILTAAFEQETARLAVGLNGGFVMLGAKTSRFTKEKFSQWIEFLHAVASERRVTVYEEEHV